MNVVTMLRYVNRDTVALLKAMLDLAERGEVTGLVLCYRLRDGNEYPEMTGMYARNLALGVSAGMRLSWHMTQLEDARRGSP